MTWLPQHSRFRSQPMLQQVHRQSSPGKDESDAYYTGDFYERKGASGSAVNVDLPQNQPQSLKGKLGKILRIPQRSHTLPRRQNPVVHQKITYGSTSRKAHHMHPPTSLSHSFSQSAAYLPWSHLQNDDDEGRASFDDDNNRVAQEPSYPPVLHITAPDTLLQSQQNSYPSNDRRDTIPSMFSEQPVHENDLQPCDLRTPRSSSSSSSSFLRRSHPPARFSSTQITGTEAASVYSQASASFDVNWYCYEVDTQKGSPLLNSNSSVGSPDKENFRGWRKSVRKGGIGGEEATVPVFSHDLPTIISAPTPRLHPLITSIKNETARNDPRDDAPPSKFKSESGRERAPSISIANYSQATNSLSSSVLASTDAIISRASPVSVAVSTARVSPTKHHHRHHRTPPPPPLNPPALFRLRPDARKKLKINEMENGRCLDHGFRDTSNRRRSESQEPFPLMSRKDLNEMASAGTSQDGKTNCQFINTSSSAWERNEKDVSTFQQRDSPEDIIDKLEWSEIEETNFRPHHHHPNVINNYHPVGSTSPFTIYRPPPSPPKTQDPHHYHLPPSHSIPGSIPCPFSKQRFSKPSGLPCPPLHHQSELSQHLNDCPHRPCVYAHRGCQFRGTQNERIQHLVDDGAAGSAFDNASGDDCDDGGQDGNNNNIYAPLGDGSISFCPEGKELKGEILSFLVNVTTEAMKIFSPSINGEVAASWLENRMRKKRNRIAKRLQGTGDAEKERKREKPEDSTMTLPQVLILPDGFEGCDSQLKDALSEWLKVPPGYDRKTAPFLLYDLDKEVRGEQG